MIIGAEQTLLCINVVRGVYNLYSVSMYTVNVVRGVHASYSVSVQTDPSAPDSCRQGNEELLEWNLNQRTRQPTAIVPTTGKYKILQKDLLLLKLLEKCFYLHPKG